MTEQSNITDKNNSGPPTAWYGLRGKIDRRAFVAVGFALLFLKYAVDSAVASFVFGRFWSLFNYFNAHQVTLLASGSPEDRVYFCTMFLVASPFIWIGVVLTVRRLRSAAMPIWLVFLFFLPTINLLFLLTMAVVPPRHRSPADISKIPDDQQRLSRLFPQRPATSAVVAVLLTVLAGLVMTGLSVYGLGMYGLGLFVGVPFCMGLIATIIFGFCGYSSGAAYRLVSVLAVLGLEALLLIIGAEGLGCLIMAAPIWLVCGVLGGLVGEAIQSYAVDRREIALVTVIIVGTVPALLGAEFFLQPPSPSQAVTTRLDIDAPPECVWENVVSFPDLEPPTEWPFRMGIAFPTSASINGAGRSAVRRCEFNTGTFVEPIEIWDPPRLLKFSVTKNAPAMHEWSFHEDVHPPHLEGYLVSRAGQFRLTALPDGGTRLEGTTWYEHNMRPAGYWRIWSDHAVGVIHGRVLRHIKSLAEASHGATMNIARPGHKRLDSGGRP